LDHVSIGHLKLFRDIAQVKSISRAAEINHISQSAASQSLKSLERSSGADLVDRSTRPLKLTPAGTLFFDAARVIVRRYEEMDTQIQGLKQEISGTVKVASIYSIGLYEMTRVKADFEKVYPRAHVQLEYMRPDEIYEAVRNDRADLGLVSYPNPTRELRKIDWRLETMVLVCHPNDALASLKSVTPQDLERSDFVSFDSGLKIRNAIDRFFREHGVHREVAYEFDNIQMIKEALTLGQGVSILPERTVRQEVLEGRLRALRIETHDLMRPVGIVLHRKRRLSGAAEEFLAYLQARPED
jgi:DNA-binding transcriptional LysR family regulator